MKRERRYLQHEIRVDDSTGSPKIRGYAAVFGKLSEDLGGFREQIAPGAFSDSLNNDIRGLFNHDSNFVLGRTKSGTMRVSQDDIGFAYEIDPPDTQMARDLMTSMKRGDIDQSSFGFYCLADSWTKGEDGTAIRTIVKADCFDCSVVTTPAYPDASAQVRSLFPDGKPEVPAPAQEIRTNENGCDCQCPECVDNDCLNCSDPDCTDENCLLNQRKAFTQSDLNKLAVLEKLAKL
jgi:HK97 family phage prohead protease